MSQKPYNLGVKLRMAPMGQRSPLGAKFTPRGEVNPLKFIPGVQG
jgi:hypothetical protein